MKVYEFVISLCGDVLIVLSDISFEMWRDYIQFVNVFSFWFEFWIKSELYCVKMKNKMRKCNEKLEDLV